MPLTSGYAVIQDQIKKNSGNSSNKNFISLANIYWKNDEERKIIRHLHDNPATIGMHEFVSCRDGKKRDFVCRQYIVTIINGQVEAIPEPCPLCQTEIFDDRNGTTRLMRPHMVAVGLAALRKVEMVNHQRIISDEMRDVDIFEDDKRQTITVPTVGVIKQSLTNFWNHFVNYYLRYGTTLDRDYEVTRQGKGGMGAGNSVTYSPIAEDMIPELRTLENLLTHYDKALQGTAPIDLLAQWINWRASEKYMTKFLSSEILNKIGWKIDSESDKQEATIQNEPPSLNENHPGGLDEFAPRNGNLAENSIPTPSKFDALRNSLNNQYKSGK